MNGLRVSISIPGAPASDLLEVARWADHWNLASLWIGDPWSRAENRADSYVTASAAAISAVTSSLRLTLVLGLRREKQLVRLAEDIAVVDQASGGRVELALVAPEEARAAWAENAARVLRAWNEWTIPSTGETVPAIPGPAQPEVPRIVVGDDESAALLGAGRLTRGGEPPAREGSLLGPRTVLVVEPDLGRDGIRGWLDRDPLGTVFELRDRAGEVRAGELLLVVPSPTQADVETIGTVLVPSLRAASRDTRAIANDSWIWITDKAELHEPPE